MNIDISPDFRFNQNDARVLRRILPFEAKPEAIKIFARYAYRLTDYAYWFTLGALWVSYTGWSDLDLWIRLFSAKRPNRDSSLMKPSELRIFEQRPSLVLAYRAHRENETRWVSYSVNAEKAGEFALRRGVTSISEYRIAREDVLALFLRRGECEIIVLDQSKAEFVRKINVVTESTTNPKGAVT